MLRLGSPERISGPVHNGDGRDPGVSFLGELGADGRITAVTCSALAKLASRPE